MVFPLLIDMMGYFFIFSEKSCPSVTRVSYATESFPGLNTDSRRFVTWKPSPTTVHNQNASLEFKHAREKYLSAVLLQEKIFKSFDTYVFPSELNAGGKWSYAQIQL